MSANQAGWGAYVAIGLRRSGLTRFRRGKLSDILALPALFADLDDPAALSRLQTFTPTPSCIVFSGGGYHAYWWLDTPCTDLRQAQIVLRALASSLDGDSLSCVQSMRLVGSVNTKQGRDNARCELVTLTEQRYRLPDFNSIVGQLQPRRTPSTPPRERQSSGRKTTFTPPPAVVREVSERLLAMGFTRSGDWLNGSCLYPHRHQHQDRSPSFGFNTRSGYANCYICGSFLLKDICSTLGIRFYAGSFSSTR